MVNIVSLKPWFSKIEINILDKTDPSIYKFIYHMSLRSDYMGIVLDGSKDYSEIIKETCLFKNIFYNIRLTKLQEYEKLDITCKTDTLKFHYFCNEKDYNSLKTIPCLGVYLDKTIKDHITNVPINYGETIKRSTTQYSSIEEYIKLNDYTLFLDTEGFVYDDIHFLNKVSSILNDNVEIKLFDYIRKRVIV